MTTQHKSVTVPELHRLVGAGERAPLYLVVGEEGLLRDEAVAAIRAAVLGPDETNTGAFNCDVVYGDETDASELLTLCSNLPMFAARRLVVVRDVGDLRAKEAERLLPYLEAPVETTCLVLTGRKVDGRVKFFQALKRVAVAVDCEPLEARALPAWIRDEAAALGLSLDDPARALLQEASGGDLGVLRREMEKLSAYVAPPKAVTVADVEAVQGADTGGTVNDLVGALRRKDRGQALRALTKVLDSGEPPLKVLGFLAWNWRQEWKSRRFSEEMLRDFEQFREADSRLKGGGRGKDRLALERMVLNLCRGAARATPAPRPFAPAR
ncbi:MAG: DNA polymerase III subunit delta [Nitrospirae bacterium]|nr:MAG: DNA polymerase III subunit delta [Nitrospirota bacterium]